MRTQSILRLAVLAGIGAIVSPAAFAEDGDAVARGKAQFLTSCGTCHTTDPTDPARQGPPLAGIVGRAAGTLPGFSYSAALRDAGWVWTDEKLDRWMTNAQTFRPGTTMNYRQAAPEKRAVILTFLKSIS
jgi:cytochrome c